jgi:hypothetical protein
MTRDFSECPHYAYCSDIKSRLDIIEQDLEAGDRMRSETHDDVVAIKQVVAEIKTNFSWIKRIGWFVIAAIITFGVYMFEQRDENISINHSHDVMLMEIKKDIQHMRSYFPHNEDHKEE